MSDYKETVGENGILGDLSSVIEEVSTALLGEDGLVKASKTTITEFETMADLVAYRLIPALSNMATVIDGALDLIKYKDQTGANVVTSHNIGEAGEYMSIDNK
jgi:hypothetical protein